MIFDYLFYKSYEYYSKGKYDSNPCLSASMLLSLVYLMLVYNIFMFFRKIFPNWSILSTPIVKVFLVSIAFLLLYFINRHYRTRIEKLQKKYKNHPANKWFKQWMFLPLLLFLLIFPFLISGLIRAIF